MVVMVGPMPHYERRTVHLADLELVKPPWPRDPELGDDVLYCGEHWRIDGLGEDLAIIRREIDPWHDEGAGL